MTMKVILDENLAADRQARDACARQTWIAVALIVLFNVTLVAVMFATVQP